MSARRGWREKVEPGLYRAHRLGCASSVDERPGRRCGCPFEAKVPGSRPGTTRTITIPGSVAQARAERRRLMAEGRPAAPAAPDFGSVHALAADWFRAGEARWSPGTFALRDHAYRTRIEPTFGETALRDLSRPRVEAWAAALVQDGTGRRAVEVAVQTLRAMLTVALDAGLVSVNAAARVRLPPAPPAERTAADRILDRDGSAALLASAHDVRQETIIRAALEAGLRRGEIAGLTWPDVRLEDRRLIVRQAVWQSKATGKVVRRPKAGKVGRVAIGERFAERLANWYAESVVEGGADAAGWVWPGRDGGPMSPSSISRMVGRVGKRAGLVDARGRHRAHAHGLRHSAGSIALAEGVPLTVVSAQLRHSRPSFTAGRYAHMLSDAELDRFAAAHATGTVGETVEETAPDPKTPTA